MFQISPPRGGGLAAAARGKTCAREGFFPTLFDDARRDNDVREHEVRAICVDCYAMRACDARDGTARGRVKGDARTMRTRMDGWMDGWVAGHGAARMTSSIDAVDARCSWAARTMRGILCVMRRSIARDGD